MYILFIIYYIYFSYTYLQFICSWLQRDLDEVHLVVFGYKYKINTRIVKVRCHLLSQNLVAQVVIASAPLNKLLFSQFINIRCNCKLYLTGQLLKSDLSNYETDMDTFYRKKSLLYSSE